MIIERGNAFCIMYFDDSFKGNHFSRQEEESFRLKILF